MKGGYLMEIPLLNRVRRFPLAPAVSLGSGDRSTSGKGQSRKRVVWDHTEVLFNPLPCFIPCRNIIEGNKRVLRWPIKKFMNQPDQIVEVDFPKYYHWQRIFVFYF